MGIQSGHFARRALGRAALGLAGAALWRPAFANSEPTLHGAYGGAGCTGVPEIAGFESWLGRPVTIVLDFLAADSWDSMLREAAWMAGCWSGANRPRLAISVPMLVQEGAPTLRDGAAGSYDAQFSALAATLAQIGYPDAILRLGWEFNGDWYRWAAAAEPGAYAAYWRRIVAAMRATPDAAFRFDWSASSGRPIPEGAYPGDDVVDLIGLDVYNQAWPLPADPATLWQTMLDRPAGLVWHREFAAAHGKPRSFPEWGTGTRPDGHGGGDDPLFITNMLGWMRQGGPVAYECYWNYRAGDYDAKLSDGRMPRAAAAMRDS